MLEANDVAQLRPVKLDREVERGWIVKSGLKAGEKVVIDGVIRVRPGMKVMPVAPAAPAAPATQAVPAGGGTRP